MRSVVERNRPEGVGRRQVLGTHHDLVIVHGVHRGAVLRYDLRIDRLGRWYPDRSDDRLTAERAVYPGIFSESVESQTFTLKDVPAGAYWSLTVYDVEGFVQGDVYNINSAFAVPEDDGSFIIHFGGDNDAVNYMDIFENWNVSLRIYEPIPVVSWPIKHTIAYIYLLVFHGRRDTLLLLG